MLKGQAIRRLGKKAKRGFRGYPMAAIAFYGPDATVAAKVTVGIVPAEDRIIGCPHEEGIDYEGPTCPMCPHWAGRDRWTGEVVQ